MNHGFSHKFFTPTPCNIVFNLISYIIYHFLYLKHIKSDVKSFELLAVKSSCPVSIFTDRTAAFSLCWYNRDSAALRKAVFFAPTTVSVFFESVMIKVRLAADTFKITESWEKYDEKRKDPWTGVLQKVFESSISPKPKKKWRDGIWVSGYM